ncbi:MAG: class I SAM-dependent methyltransferase [Chloroflexi bacterium]|nr:class I SAM-dependent methyltransferase [Chloroflexota bacterium]
MKYWTGEYVNKGEYHIELNPLWPYLPVYLEKIARVRKFLDQLNPSTQIMDAGCGEGVLVNEYHQRGYNIIGMDLNYSSERVLTGNVLNMPYADSTFDVIINLDVIEHFHFPQQELIVKEFARILKPGGNLFISIPNLAHLLSRLTFLVQGQLIRTSDISRHPGDRPMGEYLELLREHFHIRSRAGVFPTFPILSLLTKWKPARVVNLHRVYNKLLAYPNWCFLNMIVCEKNR